MQSRGLLGRRCDDSERIRRRSASSNDGQCVYDSQLLFPAVASIRSGASTSLLSLLNSYVKEGVVRKLRDEGAQLSPIYDYNWSDQLKQRNRG